MASSVGAGRDADHSDWMDDAGMWDRHDAFSQAEEDDLEEESAAQPATERTVRDDNARGTEDGTGIASGGATRRTSDKEALNT